LPLAARFATIDTIRKTGKSGGGVWKENSKPKASAKKRKKKNVTTEDSPSLQQRDPNWRSNTTGYRLSDGASLTSTNENDNKNSTPNTISPTPHNNSTSSQSSAQSSTITSSLNATSIGENGDSGGISSDVEAMVISSSQEGNFPSSKETYKESPKEQTPVTDREKRLQALNSRLAKTAGPSKSSKVALRDAHWRRYQSMEKDKDNKDKSDSS